MALVFSLLLLTSLASAGVVFPVPDPYRWDESFTVKMPQFDDEHRGLFNAVMKIEAANNEENLKEAAIKFHDHFSLEESQFKQTMDAQYTADHLAKHATFLKRFDAWTSPVPGGEVTWAKNWLVQHIKNTDFKYIDKLPHHVPTPYAWDDSVEVFYQRLDEEHKGLFDHIRELGHNPASTEALFNLKAKMRAHFDYESGIFCESETYHDCEEHKAKHDTFFTQLDTATNPVPEETLHWAENWLVQHIRNTDFQYKHKLNTYKHLVPRPYIWQPYLSVFYDQLDDEHKGLFAAIKDSVEHPADGAKYEFLKGLMKDHFDYEEGEFSKIPHYDNYIADHKAKHNFLLAKLDAGSVPIDCDFINFVEDWLVQHIMNTDFAYRGKLVHDVPEPYVWDRSFRVFYERLDDEHKGLFDCVRDCAEHPSDAAKLAFCKTKLRMHFDYEEHEFCNIPDYDCYGHYLKHYNFQTKFQAAHLPLSAEVTNFAKNWLAQHIKNTDFQYRGKLNLRRFYDVPEPFVWDRSFLVEIKQLDDEHVGLFDALRAVEDARDSKETWTHMIDIYKQHFAYEESQFTTIKDHDYDPADHKVRHDAIMKTLAGVTVPVSEEVTEFIKRWLVQHIKNTDFKYKGRMPKIHPVPEPFKWNSYFAVLYPEMDNEHKPLFDCLAQVESTPGDAALLTSCLKSYEDHFRHEEHLLAESFSYPEEDLYQHINKHNSFLAAAYGISTPVPQHFIDFAKNWLCQHIPNTDFGYKHKMPFHVPSPYVWDESFEVFYDRLDEEHKVLFREMQNLADHPDSVDILNINRDVFRDHFDYEQGQFEFCGEGCEASSHRKKHDIFFRTLTWVTVPVSHEYIDWATNWLAQHIKSTDFRYKYKLQTQHPTPEPYVWNEGFKVAYPRLDQEHVGLFEGMLAVEKDLGNKEKLDHLKKVVRDHFYYEEDEFCNGDEDLPWDYCSRHKHKHAKFSEKLGAMHAPVNHDDIKWAQDWLAQHIKNSDFGYKTNLVHPVPEPYVWDNSFAVDYSRLDSEHDVLFANILAISQRPDDAAALATLKKNLKLHFGYEESRFCAIPSYNCVDHKMKHYRFWVVMEDAHVPSDCEAINWAKNWLAQHIKNTDHGYKERLIGADSGSDFAPDFATPPNAFITYDF